MKYSESHEWVTKPVDNIVEIGVTNFALSQLGDIVYLDIYDIDNYYAKDSIFGVIEAVKTVSDLYMPVSGDLIEVNQELIDKPELYENSNPWIIRVKIHDSKEYDTLLTEDEYNNIIK